MSNGKLYLIPVPLSGGSIDSLSTHSIETTKTLTHFVAERAKTCRAFLKSIQHPIALQQIEVYEIPQRDVIEFYKNMIVEIKKGKHFGLVSEAGLPCIADPGYELVLLAHQNNIGVIPLSGPNSMMLALMASGLNAQQFQFHGYLPAKKENLRDKLIQLINEIKKTGTTQIFMETPYRNKQVLDMVKHNIPADFYLCIASAVSSSDENIKTKKIKDWNENEFTFHHDRPAIFILGK